VLIRGPSGAGKSDLALRCLALAPSPLLRHPVALVADDQVCVVLESGRLIARPPATIAGRIEVRGLGIRNIPYCAAAEIWLLADLVARADVDRMPDPPRREHLLGVDLPVVRLHAFDASAPIKLMLALGDAA
jgi:serine kinase of HPr protein (carbohydrate metabolism regulator)